MTEKDINGLLYQDSNAYRIGRKDGYDEIMSQMSDIIGKCYNTGYKDAMDFVCEWLYIYYPTIERCQSAEEAWEILEKAMEGNLCKETSNWATEYTSNTLVEE